MATMLHPTPARALQEPQGNYYEPEGAHERVITATHEAVARSRQLIREADQVLGWVRERGGRHRLYAPPDARPVELNQVTRAQNYGRIEIAHELRA